MVNGHLDMEMFATNPGEEETLMWLPGFGGLGYYLDLLVCFDFASDGFVQTDIQQHASNPEICVTRCYLVWRGRVVTCMVSGISGMGDTELAYVKTVG